MRAPAVLTTDLEPVLATLERIQALFNGAER
jgi:hypothetical protein